MKIIDLHTHSNQSDGSMSPAELIHHAKEMNLSAIALTDHDTTAGIDEAMAAAEAEQIELIPGIELSAFYKDREVHIVGLFIDHTNQEFQDNIYEVCHDRADRNLHMIRLMRQSGIDITPESLAAEEGDGVLTRANFANYLKRHGYVHSNNEAFDRYLGIGKPFYLPRKYLSPGAAIHNIKLAGGIPILAHPLLYHFNETNLERCVSEFKDMGVEGIEVYYSRNTNHDTLRVRHMADQYGLLYSGGSDFHGTYKPDIELASGTGNLCIPYDVLEKMQQKREYHK